MSSCDHDAVLQALAIDAKRPASEERLASLLDTIARFDTLTGLADREVVARALHDKARVLFELRRAEDGKAALAELDARFGTAEPELRYWVCYAHFGAAKSMKPHESIDAYAAVVRAASVAPEMDAVAAEALYGMGLCGKFLPPEAPLCVRADAALRELEARYLASPDPKVARWVTAGMLTLAGRCWPESAEAEAIYERLVAAYGDAAPELQEHALQALSDWARRLFRRDLTLALPVWDRAWARFAALRSPSAQATLAGDRVSRAVALGKLHGPDSERAAYEEILAQLWDTPWPPVQTWVVAASENLAITIREAAPEEAEAVLTRALDRFGLASEPVELTRAVAKARARLAAWRTPRA